MMNERIKELAEQAEYNTRKEHNNAYWSLQNEIAEDETFLKKFAELIVRECARVITNGGYWTDILGNRKNASLDEISQMVKEHFGVSE